jgi:RNA polymerase sigma factor (sigma-70 family)
MTPTEATNLVRCAQSGDTAAFNQIVYRYQDMAVGYARSLLGEFDLAEDAAQEAFMDAYIKLCTLRDPRKFAPWFRKIVFKHCDRITRSVRHLTISTDAMQDLASPLPSPYYLVERQQTQTIVQEAIEKLPDTERTVVILFYIAQYSYRDIAQFLDITPNAVKTRLYSARQRLHERILPMVEDNLREHCPSRNEKFADRVIKSTLPLQFEAWNDATRSPQTVGTTVGMRDVSPPEARIWYLKPTGRIGEEEWDRIFNILETYAIPGLEVTETFSDRHLQRLSRLGNLLYLNLNRSKVTDVGLQNLARFPNLEHLHLSGCQGVTDAGLVVLRQTSRLRHFHVEHHQGITDAGIAYLSEHRDLEKVALLGTNTGDGALQALTGKPRLSHISLGSSVTDAGLAHLLAFPAFRTWRNEIPVMSLLANVAQPSLLMLNLKAPVTDAGLAHLAHLDGLHAVNLFGTTGSAVFDDSQSPISERGIAHLANMANLGWLGCCASKCTDAVLLQIGQMPHLRFLNCQDTVAGDQGFEALSQSQTIQHIWGRRCYNLGDRGFAALASMPALNGLAVSCRNVGESGLSILPSFPVLKEIVPIDVTDPGFVHIGRCKGLDVLNNMYCPEMTDVATAHIRSLALKAYRVWSSQITDRSLEILGQMNSLEHLLFYNCEITDRGLAAIVNLPNLKDVALERLGKVTETGIGCFPSRVQIKYEP